MREILFRGKRLDNGEWVQGCYDRWRENIYITENYYNTSMRARFAVDPATVGQFTGLTDKYGKKIFEGDICRLSRVGTVAYGKITFKNGGYWFVDDDFGGLLRLCDCNTNGFSIEIIGNIHDNPEMLKGGADNE